MKKIAIGKMLMSTLMVFVFLPSITEAREVSIEQRITGLYVAYFDRSADQSGLNFWKGEASASSDDVLSTLNKISAMFANNEVFTSTYSQLLNREFVEAIYQNALGLSGDSQGIDYWTERLNSGITRSDMVAKFIDVSLTVDMTAANFPDLSIAELSAGQARQNLIANKVTIAARFTEVMGNKSNLSTHGDPTTDPAYQASVCILDDVTASSSVVSSLMTFLNTATIESINTRCGIAPSGGVGVHILKNHSYYVDSIDYLHIVGEVENNTDDYLEYVKIPVNIFDDKGSLIDTNFTYTSLRTLAPHEKTCFNISLSKPLKWSNYQFEAPKYHTEAIPIPKLTAYNHSGTLKPTFGWYEILGMVKNKTEKSVKYVKPIATLYNAEGKVIDCNYTFVSNTHLNAHQNSSFKMTSISRDNYAEVSRYTLQVNGIAQ